MIPRGKNVFFFLNYYEIEGERRMKDEKKKRVEKKIRRYLLRLTVKRVCG